MYISVTIGPVPTASALAWIDAASLTVATLREKPELGVPPEVVDAFEGFVASFAAHAEGHPEEFLWSEPVDEAVVRNVGLHWARIVSVTRSGRETGLAPAAPEGAAFYEALATGIAVALAAGDPPIARAFADVVPSFGAPAHEVGPDPPIRVVVVDAHAEIRMLLRAFLEGDPVFEVVGEAADGTEAIEVVGATQPDAVVLDVEMPVLSGIDALPALRAVAPSTAFVVFSASERETDALAAGATAYVSKAGPMRRVVEAIISAARRDRS